MAADKDNIVWRYIEGKKYGIPNGVRPDHMDKFLDDCAKHGFYNWEGVRLQPSLVIKSRVFNKKWCLRGKFDHFELIGVTLEEGADFSGSTFDNVKIEHLVCNSILKFEKCEFNGKTEIEGDFETVSYDDSKFKDVTTFKGLYKNSVSFTRCVFFETTRFSGIASVTGSEALRIRHIITGDGANVTDEGSAGFLNSLKRLKAKLSEYIENCYKKTLEEIRKLFNALKNKAGNYKRKHFGSNDGTVTVKRLFAGRVSFHEVDFIQPEKIFFNSVDLMNVAFDGVNLRGVNFNDISFYQTKLRRHGLLSETELLKLVDKGIIGHELPRVESACKNIRVALEENKIFGIATDIYVGEMEARRKQLRLLKRHCFSVETLFRTVSNYGQSPNRAGWILFSLTLIHLALSSVMQGVEFGVLEQAEFFSELLDNMLRTLQVISLQKVPSIENVYIELLDAIFRVLVPLQAGMLALALRAKTKRY